MQKIVPLDAGVLPDASNQETITNQIVYSEETMSGNPYEALNNDLTIQLNSLYSQVGGNIEQTIKDLSNTPNRDFDAIKAAYIDIAADLFARTDLDKGAVYHYLTNRDWASITSRLIALNTEGYGPWVDALINALDGYIQANRIATPTTNFSHATYQQTARSLSPVSLPSTLSTVTSLPAVQSVQTVASQPADLTTFEGIQAAATRGSIDADEARVALATLTLFDGDEQRIAAQLAAWGIGPDTSIHVEPLMDAEGNVTSMTGGWYAAAREAYNAGQSEEHVKQLLRTYYAAQQGATTEHVENAVNQSYASFAPIPRQSSQVAQTQQPVQQLALQNPQPAQAVQQLTPQISSQPWTSVTVRPYTAETTTAPVEMQPQLQTAPLVASTPVSSSVAQSID